MSMNWMSSVKSCSSGWLFLSPLTWCMFDRGKEICLSTAASVEEANLDQRMTKLLCLPHLSICIRGALDIGKLLAYFKQTECPHLWLCPAQELCFSVKWLESEEYWWCWDSERISSPHVPPCRPLAEPARKHVHPNWNCRHGNRVSLLQENMWLTGQPWDQRPSTGVYDEMMKGLIYWGYMWGPTRLGAGSMVIALYNIDNCNVFKLLHLFCLPNKFTLLWLNSEAPSGQQGQRNPNFNCHSI